MSDQPSLVAINHDPRHIAMHELNQPTSKGEDYPMLSLEELKRVQGFPLLFVSPPCVARPTYPCGRRS